MSDRKPAEVFAPGEFLKEELEARGWSQIELAEILDRPARLISEIISGKRSITPETAKGLSAAFGTSAEYWMRLETSYQLSKAKVEESEVTRRARLYGKFPVKEMLKRGWIEASDNIEVLEKRFLDFFNLRSIDEELNFAHSAKRSKYENLSNLQLAWLCRARQLANAVTVNKFSANVLGECISELRACLEYAESIRQVPSILGKYGISLVVVEAFPGLKMSAACFWLSNDRPVIAMAILRDQIDIFWHTLFHELDHIINGEGKGDDFIFENIELSDSWDNLPPQERRANENAAEYCLPQSELTGFIARVSPIFSETNILGFAKRIQTHPGIVVGQLQKRGLIPWSFHKKFLEKIRHILVPAALTDGFGNKIAL